MSTTVDAAGSKRKCRITHPFHPQYGQEFELIASRRAWGEERVYFYDGSGELKLLPASWTDSGAADPFVVISAGRCYFRVEDLLRLAELLENLEEFGGERTGSEAASSK